MLKMLYIFFKWLVLLFFVFLAMMLGSWLYIDIILSSGTVYDTVDYMVDNYFRIILQIMVVSIPASTAITHWEIKQKKY